MTDQQRFDTINALGFEYMNTPNLDRLVKEGVTFSNCHITAASCVPSRASLFNGYYPHTTGIVANDTNWKHSWVEKLQEAGYKTLNFGKMHTIPFDAPAGFDERFIVENKDRYLQKRWYVDEWDKALAARGLIKQQREFYRKRDDYNTALGAFDWELPEDLHSDMFVGNFAKWWLDTRPQAEPLFMQIGFPGPHPPYDPTTKYSDQYIHRTDLPKVISTPEDLEKQPSYLKHKRKHDAEVDHDSVVWNPDRTDEDLHRMRAYYYANVTMIDECVGNILDSLEANGYLDNTIVIFTSDHGDCMGDHGLIQKWSMFDVVTRVPTIVWAPNRFKGGRVEDGLCQLFDLAPTILELAGVDVPEDFEAESLMPVLNGDDWTPRDYVYCEQAGDVAMTGADFITMIRGTRWKLVHIQGTDEGQMYDLESDPEEVVNLWDDVDYADVKSDLLIKMLNWQINSQFKTRNWQHAIR